MGGTHSSFGGQHQTVWFTDFDRVAEVDRIQAIVVRLNPPGKQGFRQLSRVGLWWFKLKWRLSIIPLFLGMLLRRSDEWSASSGSGENDPIRLSRKRQVVSVSGREFAFPNDDRALLVLVDARDETHPAFETREVRPPVIHRERLERTDDRPDMREELMRQERERMARARSAWTTWMDEQPDIRAFLATHR